MKPVKIKLQPIILIWMGLFSAGQLFADVSISGINNVTINSWSGISNSLEGSDTYCVISCNGACNQPQTFDVAAYTSGPTDASGNFYLTHTGNGTTTLRTAFEWTNPTRGTFTMTNYNVTGFTAPPSSPYAPGATSCAQANSQNRITIKIAEGDLATALAGTYSGVYSIDMCRVNNGGNTVECVAPVGFTVTLPELIQITQLKNFMLTTWAGVGSVQRSEDFCVFRNGYGGFAITATGNNDAGGNFRLRSGSNTIPYSVQFNDGGAWHNAVPGSQLSNSVTGFTGVSRRNCGGSTSHTMRVTIQEMDLSAARSGDYTDTITILVEPT
jgi:hypothetical protein